MTLEIDAGEIKFTNDAGVVKFTTNDTIFHTLTTVDATVNIGTFNFDGVGRLTNTTDFTVASVDPLCTHAFGAIRFSTTGAIGVAPVNQWVTFLGGSIVWVNDDRLTFLSPSPVREEGCTQWMTFTPFISGGTLYIRRKSAWYRGSSGQTVFQVTPVTLECKLECGAFS